MKAFFSISIVLFFALQDVNINLMATTQEVEQVKQVLTANPWKQVSLTVSPAIMIDDEMGIAVSDLHALQSEEEQNQIIKFDREGNYKIGSGSSLLSADMMFASRKVSEKETKTDENMNVLEGVNESPVVNLLETGSWVMNGENKLVLMADNGRMKEETFRFKSMGYDKVVLTYTKIINGEEHTFTQVLEAQPFIDLGW